MKLYEPHRTRAVRREVAALQEVAETPGIPAPRLITSGQSHVVLEELPGIPLSQAVDQGDLSEANALRTLGSLLSKFHQKRRDQFGSAAEGPRWRAASEVLDEFTANRANLLRQHGQDMLAEELIALAERCRPLLADAGAATFCHGDLHLDNVLITADERLAVTGVIDYESSIYLIPEYDIAKTLVVCSAFRPDQRQALISGYQTACPISPELISLLTRHHAIDGWLWANLIERRDQDLWNSRLDKAILVERNNRLDRSRPVRAARSR